MNISVRRLDRKCGQGDVEFWTEISVLSDLKHENIISIIGFCDEKNEKIIISTYEANGSLERHLKNPKLTWMQRLRICVAVARGLSYLHYDEGRSYSVIHRNINSYTILLDENWEAKLSGFEISLKQSVNRMDQILLSEAVGTVGYMDPAIENTGGVTCKSDVYSFGVVLFEMLCGRKAFIPNEANRLLAPLAKFHYEKKSMYDIIHPDLWKQMDPDSRSKFSKAAYSCLKEQGQRPNMDQVVSELERALELQLQHGKSLLNLKIPLSDIKLATNNFSKTYEIFGVDGYITLYRAELGNFDKKNPSVKGKNKGELPEKQNTVVIKRYLPRKDRKGEERFLTEIELLTTCKHHNIVTILGFCDEGSEMILVIEQLSNGYLGNYLANMNNDMPILTWAKRLEICLDVAYGLNYLHSKMIINRDIRSDYIALDENLRAKIVDFGLSVFVHPNQDGDALFHDRQRIIGSAQYMDPEYTRTGKLKKESDIYSFGVVLFEILCGRRAYDPIYLKESDKGLAHVARRCMYEGKLNEMIDPVLKKETGANNLALNRGPNKDSLDTFLKIAYQCVALTQEQRPTMEVIIKKLENASSFQEQGKHQYMNPVDESNKAVEHVEHQLTHENPGKNLEHLKIPLGDINLATSYFSKTYNIFTVGGYYELYRAQLHFDKENPSSIEGMNKGEPPNTQKTVVIKRFFRREDSLSKAFSTNIEMLATCKHRNIVTLLGFCDEGSDMILVIEHLSSILGHSLGNINDTSILTWARRLRICLDVANGLNYLHSKMMINRDIRSDYIALDVDGRAKIADFGISVFLPPNQDGDALLHERPRILGTLQYMDPEYIRTGKLKRESDIYGFGVVLFELLCGRRAYDPIYLEESDKGLAHVARRCFFEGKLNEIIDPIIREETGENSSVLRRGPNKDSLDTFIKIAYECVAETQDQRPTMKVIIKELEKALFLEEQGKHQYMNPVDDGNKAVEHVEHQLTHENPRKNLEHLKNLKISLSDIKLATHDFSETHNIFGVDGFYEMYRAELNHLDKENPSSIEGMNKGELPKRRDTVVIKRFLPREDKEGEERFLTEIEMLTTCKHYNIITLLGFCDEGSEMILVTEHLSNGYLGLYLANINEMPLLTWAQRLKICLDVANGIKYLHSEMIINRDIRSDYIVFNENWRAKIADFAVSVLLPQNQDGDTLLNDRQGILGTTQYVDPEYFRTGRLKRESDVYSFGVVLFEILCGRLAYDPIYLRESDKGLVHVAQRCFQEGKLNEMIDPRISEETGENHFDLNRGVNKDSLDAFIKIALECVAETQVQRPTMNVVIKELEKALTFQENHKNYLKISLESIKLATQNFHPHNCIGGGGFGKVFIGKVPKDDEFNTIVAKRLDTSLGQGEQQFFSELQILYEYKHENVIRLLGYCDEKEDKIIVYEHASRGSLDKYLNDNRLRWIKRLEICVDVATALNFLHGGAGTQAKVIHRDIKTANILLNDDWKAKIADFGLSLISAINQETDYVIDHACGTPGYLDPLYRKSGFLTIESDIYSFGVVLFEILCGRSTYDIHKKEGRFLPSFIKHLFEEGKHDEMVFEAIKQQIKLNSLTTFQRIACQCLEDDRAKRPTAKEVLAQLKMALEFQEDR